MNKFLIIFFIVFGSTALLQAQKYFLTLHQSDASCDGYSIQDSIGNDIVLLPQVKQALECPSVINLRNNILITYINNELVWYNITLKKLQTLAKLYPDVDGVSNPVWSPNGKMVMFTIINQQKKYGYKEFVRIMVLGVDENGKVTLKKKYDRPVHFSCGSICTSSPETDFKFKDDNSIEYRRHELIDDRPGEWETIQLK